MANRSFTFDASSLILTVHHGLILRNFSYLSLSIPLLDLRSRSGGESLQRLSQNGLPQADVDAYSQEYPNRPVSSLVFYTVTRIRIAYYFCESTHHSGRLWLS